VPISLPTPWRCLWIATSGSRPWSPFRRNEAGDIECMASDDGRNCLWTADEAACMAEHIVDINNLNALACGVEHQAIYGSPGYESPDHWCSIREQHLSGLSGEGCSSIPRYCPLFCCALSVHASWQRHYVPRTLNSALCCVFQVVVPRLRRLSYGTSSFVHRMSGWY
jgi:hypothetical protein